MKTSCWAQPPTLRVSGSKATPTATTRWASRANEPEWIYVDLGQTASISKVILHWEAAYSRGYQLQISDNADSWTTLHTETNGDGDTDEITVSGIGRYVRVYCTARATQWGNSLWEIEILGEATTATGTKAPMARTLSLYPVQALFFQPGYGTY